MLARPPVRRAIRGAFARRCWAAREGGWVVASDVRLATIGAQPIREIEPGELLAINAEGVHSEQFAPPTRRAGCSFEFIYFARPDSLVDGQLVYSASAWANSSRRSPG